MLNYAVRLNMTKHEKTLGLLTIRNLMVSHGPVH